MLGNIHHGKSNLAIVRRVVHIKPSLRWWVIAGSAAFYLALQLWHAIKDVNRWPICTYNLFNYHLDDTFPQARVRLITDRGNVVGPTDPWGLLPLDFFRVVSVLERMFFAEPETVDGRDAGPDPDGAARVRNELRDRWCATVLRGLNDVAWSAFDEVRVPLRPPAGERFTAFELYLVQVDFSRFDPNDRSQVVSANLIHRYDPDGWATRVEDPFWRICPPVAP